MKYYITFQKYLNILNVWSWTQNRSLASLTSHIEWTNLFQYKQRLKNLSQRFLKGFVKLFGKQGFKSRKKNAWKLICKHHVNPRVLLLADDYFAVARWVLHQQKVPSLTKSFLLKQDFKRTSILWKYLEKRLKPFQYAHKHCIFPNILNDKTWQGFHRSPPHKHSQFYNILAFVLKSNKVFPLNLDISDPWITWTMWMCGKQAGKACFFIPL